MSTAKEYVAQFCKEAKVTVLKEKSDKDGFKDVTIEIPFFANLKFIGYSEPIKGKQLGLFVVHKQILNSPLTEGCVKFSPSNYGLTYTPNGCLVTINYAELVTQNKRVAAKLNKTIAFKIAKDFYDQVGITPPTDTDEFATLVGNIVWETKNTVLEPEFAKIRESAEPA